MLSAVPLKMMTQRQYCWWMQVMHSILLVDASNAFNSLNRKTALHNIRSLCPTLSTILINTYRSDPVCFVDGDTLHSREGTTQGDPLAMPMYDIATMPLIQALQRDVKQVWYADDASATGGVNQLRNWWRSLCDIGPSFGYYPNPSKTWLVVKDGHRW